MATDTFAVSFTAKCGPELLFSRVASVDLNKTLSSLFDKHADDKYVLQATKISAGPSGPWQHVDAGELMSVLHGLSYRHILFGCDPPLEEIIVQAPHQQPNAFQHLMNAAKKKGLPKNKACFL